MSNQHPVQTEAFKQHQFKGFVEDSSEPLAKKVTGVKLPESIHGALQSLPQEERVKYLRRVITEAVRRDLLERRD